MVDDFADEILNEFLEEASEPLEKLDQDFVLLEENPSDFDLINNIFRTIHTLKGTSGFLGLKKLEKVSHVTEDILSKCRSGKMNVGPEIITVLLESVDAMKAIVESLVETRDEGTGDYTELTGRLRSVLEGGAPTPEKNKGAEKEKTAEPGPAKTEIAAVDVKEALSPEDVKKAPDVKEKEKESASKKESGEPAKSDQGHAALTDSAVRVDIGLLDILMNLVGELVLSRNQILQAVESDDLNTVRGGTQRLNQITSDLQTSIMQTRMQPIGNAFSKFPRVVRDLTRTNNKQIKLVLEGEETGVDKTLLEAIKDPLIHVVRNSVDHGIEAASEREARNKNAQGTLSIRAYHENGQVVVEVEDDGSGIDPEKVLSKAVEKGLLTNEDAVKMSEREIQSLIFRPGFSTVDKVSNISGRGVGMDVVKTNIEKVGGTVDLSSRKGKGTTIKLQIPLTLAIIPALVLICNERRYTIPQVNIQKLIYLEGENARSAIEKIHNTEVFRLRGELISLVRLREILKIPTVKEKESREDETLFIIVLKCGGPPFALVVDQIVDSEEIVVKPLISGLKKEEAYAGATILGDGEVALILDPAGLESIGLSANGEKGVRVVENADEEGDDDVQSLLLFSIGKNEPFALPVPIISRVEEIVGDSIKRVGGKEVIQYRGSLLQLIRLNDTLDISPLEEEDSYTVIVFDFSGQIIGLLVNSIVDSVDIVAEIDTSIYNVPGILGSLFVGDTPVLLIDIYKIIEKSIPEFFQDNREDQLESAPKEYKILVVEDSPFFLGLEKSYLESGGYIVETASDGVEGFSKVEKGDFDLIITDIEMPNMNGFEFIEKVRKQKNIVQMPVMAVTSLTGEEQRKMAVRAGIDDYRVKIDREQILEGVRMLLKKGRPA